MSTLWTPDGERPIRRAEPTEPEAAPAGPVPEDPDDAALAAEDSAMEAEMERMQQELAATPAEVVIANHAVGLFNLAGLHLSQQPPNFDQARLAIDALAALVEGLAGRLGPDEHALSDGLSQLRLAFVQISAAHRAAPDQTEA
jgi:Domain of unknown function (DUF1844)